MVINRIYGESCVPEKLVDEFNGGCCIIGIAGDIYRTGRACPGEFGRIKIRLEDDIRIGTVADRFDPHCVGQVRMWINRHIKFRTIACTCRIMWYYFIDYRVDLIPTVKKVLV